MGLFSNSGIESWEVMVTTVAAAATPYLAFKFRERRQKRPAGPTEALYQYYENYIDRLEKALAAKDVIIERQDKQIREQGRVIDRLQSELDNNRRQLRIGQQQIDDLKYKVAELQGSAGEFHQKIDELKAQSPDVPSEA